MLAHRHEPSARDLEAAFSDAGCLGPWRLDGIADRLLLPAPLAAWLGIGSEPTRLDLIDAIHAEDGCRIDSVLHEALQFGAPFETEFRSRPGRHGIRLLRLMGRCDAEARRLRGLAFDLTESRCAAGPPALRAQRQANRLAEHVIAMKGLVTDLDNAPMDRLIDELARETGYELARRLRHAGQIGRA